MSQAKLRWFLRHLGSFFCATSYSTYTKGTGPQLIFTQQEGSLCALAILRTKPTIAATAKSSDIDTCFILDFFSLFGNSRLSFSSSALLWLFPAWQGFPPKKTVGEIGESGSFSTKSICQKTAHYDAKRQNTVFSVPSHLTEKIYHNYKLFLKQRYHI